MIRFALHDRITNLLVKALGAARGSDQSLLLKIVPNNGLQQKVIDLVRDIYHSTGAIDAARAEIERSTREAQRALKRLPQGRARSMLLWLSERLVERQS